MNFKVKHVTFIVLNLCVIFANSHTATKTNKKADDSNPFLDIATSFLQETFANQQGGRGAGSGNNGIAGIAQLIGSLVQQDGSKSNNGGLGAAQILTGISQLIGANNGGGSGIDPSFIGNVIEMFTTGGDNSDDDDDQPQAKRRKRSNGQDSGIGLDTILNIASVFMGNANNVDSNTDKNEGLMSLLPMAIQAINSFSGPDGDKIHAKHKDHQWILPPFLERIHVMWDHFSNSELAEALWDKSGINQIFKVRLFYEKKKKQHKKNISTTVLPIDAF